MERFVFARPHADRKAYDPIIANFVARHSAAKSRRFEIEATRGHFKKGVMLGLWWGDAGAWWKHGLIVEIDWRRWRYARGSRADYRVNTLKDAGARGLYVQLRPFALRAL